MRDRIYILSSKRTSGLRHCLDCDRLTVKHPRIKSIVTAYGTRYSFQDKKVGTKYTNKRALQMICRIFYTKKKPLFSVRDHSRLCSNFILLVWYLRTSLTSTYIAFAF